MRNAEKIDSGYHIKQHHIKELLEDNIVSESRDDLKLCHVYTPNDNYIIKDYDGTKVLRIETLNSNWPYMLILEDGTEIPTRILILEVVEI